MNKQEALELVSRNLLGMETLHVRGYDRLDFHTLHVTNISAALSTMYEHGISSGYLQGQQSILENPHQQAPAEPRCKVVHVPAVDTTVCVFAPVQGIVAVQQLDRTGITNYDLDVTSIDNPELMAAHFEHMVVGAFVALMRILGELHQGTIVWDEAPAVNYV